MAGAAGSAHGFRFGKKDKRIGICNPPWKKGLKDMSEAKKTLAYAWLEIHGLWVVYLNLQLP